MNLAKIKGMLKMAGGAVILAFTGVTNSGALLSWEVSDFTKFDNAGAAIAHNSFLTLDLLPYYILVGAVVYILNKAFGIFKFGQ